MNPSDWSSDVCSSDLQDITKKVGLNRQTFYYHFTDKYDLLRWIYRHDALIYLETD